MLLHRSPRRAGWRGVALFALCAGMLSPAGRVSARPTAPALLCQEYESAPECAGKVVSCTFCHEGIDPPSWNAYGKLVKKAMPPSLPYERALPDALHAVERDDADGDGVANLAEIEIGTLPGDARSVLEEQVPEDAEPGAHAAYDPVFAYRRITTLYCGVPPSYDDLSAIKELSSDEEAVRARLHETLDACLASDSWQKDALLRLADKRIKPQSAVGADTKVMIGPMRLVIGDYHFDYRLWRYTLSNDRDMRELLTADYHVLEAEDGKLKISREVLPKPDARALAGGQPLPPERRAGMLTTQWFLAYNTMFSPLPRTSAAQAYRAYLGADVSAGEGLIPVPSEPSDIDKKGVAHPRCANCHSTLDPLAYAFVRYEGIEMQYGLSIGKYSEDRPTRRIPGWDDGKQKPFLFGQPVADLVELAKVASNSDEFKRNMAQMFFVHALGRKPTPAEQPEFAELWRSLPKDRYSANRLLHRLIDTHSFGAP